MNSQLVAIFLLSLSAMLNPSLLAALTVMLLLPNPKRLMVGYLLGAYLTSITGRPRPEGRSRGRPSSLSYLAFGSLLSIGASAAVGVTRTSARSGGRAVPR
jgi:hypothetical protein